MSDHDEAWAVLTSLREAVSAKDLDRMTALFGPEGSSSASRACNQGTEAIFHGSLPDV